MSAVHECIVVGGGISGLTAAAYLAKAGLRPLLLEKNEKTGGLVNTFEREGFCFDGGARALANSGIILPMFRNLGIELPICENKVTIAIENERVRLDSIESLEDYGKMLEHIFPELKEDIARIIHVTAELTEDFRVIYGIDNPLFRDDFKNLEYLKSTLLPWLGDYRKSLKRMKKLQEPIEVFLARLTDSQALIDMVAQHFFAGTPAFFALSYFGLYLDYFYPKGGMGKAAEALTNYITEHGGELRTGTEAAELFCKKHLLLTADGERFRYKHLIWAADQATLYRITKECESRRFLKQKKSTEKAKAADSVLTLFAALDVPPENLAERVGAHCFYSPDASGLHSLKKADDWEAFFAKTTYEICCPALRDPSLAPEGKTGLVISCLFSYEDVKNFPEEGGEEAFKALAQAQMSKVLARTILPEFNEHVLYSICSTPLSIERRIGSKEGGISGWSFLNEVMPSEHRFSKIMRASGTEIPDVLQCGQWTFSPAGVPTSILSGKLAADKLSAKRKG